MPRRAATSTPILFTTVTALSPPAPVVEVRVYGVTHARSSMRLCQADAVALEFTFLCSSHPPCGALSLPHFTGEETEVWRVRNLSEITQQVTGKEGFEPWSVTREPEA